jgi:hypothetical protein
VGVGDAVDGDCDGGLDHVSATWEAVVSACAEVSSYGAVGAGAQQAGRRADAQVCAYGGTRAEDDGGAGLDYVGAVDWKAGPTPSPSPFGYKWRGRSSAGFEILGD